MPTFSSKKIIGTHYPIASYAIERGIHVLITKPATQLLAHHNALIEAARKHNVVCFVEHHKRYAQHGI
jgi:D-galacturonate reductase